MEFMDAQKGSVYYVAFGTLAYPKKEQLEPLLNFLKKRMEKEEISLIISLKNENLRNFVEKKFEKNERVFISSWVNQRAILNHKKLRIFFTHAGMSSLTESIFEKKPVLCFPLAYEQFLSAARIEELGMGEFIDFDDYDENLIDSKISLIEKEYHSYLDKILSFSRVNQLIGGAQTAANIIEAFHLAPHLFIDPSNSLSIFTYYNLDLFIIAFVLLFVVQKSMRFFLKSIFSSRKKINFEKIKSN